MKYSIFTLLHPSLSFILQRRIKKDLLFWLAVVFSDQCPTFKFRIINKRSRTDILINNLLKRKDQWDSPRLFQLYAY
jgi:hypothetical protein